MAEKRRRGRGGLTKTALVGRVKEWLTLKANAEQVSARVNELREGLVSWIEEYGYEDDKGHGILELPEEIDGIVGLKRERRVSKSIAEAELMEELRKRGVDGVIKCREYVDQDELYSTIFKTEQKLRDNPNYKLKKGDFTQAMLDDFVSTRETFALKPIASR